MYVGLISDTHGIFAPEFRKFFEPVDVIWHAGDWGHGYEFTKEFSGFKPVVGVFGNCDGYDIRCEYPRYQSFEADGTCVLMTHIGGTPGRYDSSARKLIESYRPRIFVCGHSHILKVQWDEYYQMMYLNPGAAGVQGWQVMRTALRFRVHDGNITDLEVYNLPR